MQKTLDREAVEQAVKRIQERGKCPASAIQGAIAMRRESDDFATWSDRFAVFASWHGHKVIIDGVEWIPPLVEEA